MDEEPPGDEEERKDELAESVSGDLPEDLHTSVDLVHRAQGGDAQALNDLLARYQSRLQRIVRIRLGAKLKQHVESVDIVQEAFAVAFRKFDDFELRSHASILQWLSRIAENKIKDANDYLFAKKRDRDRDLPLERPAAGTTSVSGLRLAADQTAPDERAMKREIRDLMDQAMTELPEDYREVILLRDYSGADWEFVAGALDRGAHACQELYRRAWIRLRREVRKRMGEGE